MTFTCNSVSIGKSAAEHRAMPSDSAPIMVPKGIREGNREVGRKEGREDNRWGELVTDRKTYRAITAEVKGKSRRYQRRERG